MSDDDCQRKVASSSNRIERERRAFCSGLNTSWTECGKFVVGIRYQHKIKMKVITPLSMISICYIHGQRRAGATQTEPTIPKKESDCTNGLFSTCFQCRYPAISRMRMMFSSCCILSPLQTIISRFKAAWKLDDTIMIHLRVCSGAPFLSSLWIVIWKNDSKGIRETKQERKMVSERMDSGSVSFFHPFVMSSSLMKKSLWQRNMGRETQRLCPPVPCLMTWVSGRKDQREPARDNNYLAVEWFADDVSKATTRTREWIMLHLHWEQSLQLNAADSRGDHQV